MRRTFPVLVAFTMIMLITDGCRADQILKEWKFDRAGGLQGWVANGMLADVEIRDDALHMRATDWDPSLVGPQFEIAAAPWEYIEIVLRATKSGDAEFFWTNTTATKYGGFSPGKETHFQVVGDSRFHTYRLYPFWQGEKKIILLRFDPYDGAEFDVQRITIGELDRPKTNRTSFTFDDGADGWQAALGVDTVAVRDGALKVKLKSGGGSILSPRFTGDLSRYHYMSVRMAVDRGTVCSAGFASPDHSGEQTIPLMLKADGRMHYYNFPLVFSETPGGVGEVTLSPSNEEGAVARIDAVTFGDAQVGPPDLTLGPLSAEIPVCRVNQKVALSLQLRNDGGTPARELQVHLTADDGVRILQTPAALPSRLDFGDDTTARWLVQADKPGHYTFTVTATCAGVTDGPERRTAEIDFTPGLGLPKADYVPEPHPVKSPYHIGVYYFPGWHYGTHVGWDVIKPFPERMPLLGWYNEGNPEVHDWEIKWAVEHGIEFFIFDWYRVGTNRPVEVMLGDALDNGFLHARYRNEMKFAVMWENANGAGVSDEADLLHNLLPFWIKHYFTQPNYMRVDGKPLLIVYAPQRLDRDLGTPEQVRSGLDAMHQACAKAGLKGLYIIAVCNENATTLARMKEEGYDATSHYAYPRPGTSHPPRGMTTYDYSEIIDLHEKIWKEKRAAGQLPDIPALTAGWDPRPWHGAKTTYYWTGNTPDKFAEMCRRAKKLVDTDPASSPVSKFVFMEALNEWGEGSYLSPSRGYGFGYFDAIRDVFTNTPHKHLDFTPWDVGLGPYEATPAPPKTAWEFNSAGDLEGWRGFRGLTASVVTGGLLQSTSTDADPVYLGPPMKVKAHDYAAVVVRMKADHNSSGQLFWQTRLFGMAESASVHFNVIGDNQFHEYRLDVAANPRWWGTITGFRFDPNATANTAFAVDYIRLVSK